MSLSAQLAKPVGPMPLGAWLLVGAGGLYIAYRSRGAGQDAGVVAAAGQPGLPTGGGLDVQGADTWDGAPVVLSPIINVPKPDPTVVNVLPATPIVNVSAPPASHPTVPPPAATTPRPTTPGAHARPRSYTVRSGDTLSEIAARYHTVGGWPILYSVNKSVIEQAAKRHGFRSSGGGHWIFPGTVLRLP